MCAEKNQYLSRAAAISAAVWTNEENPSDTRLHEHVVTQTILRSIRNDGASFPDGIPGRDITKFKLPSEQQKIEFHLHFGPLRPYTY